MPPHNSPRPRRCCVSAAEPASELLAELPGQNPSDRILLEEGCALLGVRVDTFRDQYLTAERYEVSVRHFGILKARGRVTLSRRLVLAHLEAVARDPWGSDQFFARPHSSHG